MMVFVCPIVLNVVTVLVGFITFAGVMVFFCVVVLVGMILFSGIMVLIDVIILSVMAAVVRKLKFAGVLRSFGARGPPAT